MQQKGPQRDLEKQRFWQRHVGGWRQSGRSIREYCRENALSEPAFYAWRRELARRRQVSGTAARAARKATRRPKAPRTATTAPGGRRQQRPAPSCGTPSFVPVRVVPPGSAADGRRVPACGQATARGAAGGVEILLEHQRTVRVCAGFDRQTLCAVLAVLEGRPC
jgi:hypothetical protein